MADEWISGSEAGRVTGQRSESLLRYAVLGLIRTKIGPGARIKYHRGDAERLAIGVGRASKGRQRVLADRRLLDERVSGSKIIESIDGVHGLGVVSEDWHDGVDAALEAVVGVLRRAGFLVDLVIDDETADASYVLRRPPPE